jgi:hypothetical protein
MLLKSVMQLRCKNPGFASSKPLRGLLRRVRRHIKSRIKKIEQKQSAQRRSKER